MAMTTTQHRYNVLASNLLFVMFFLSIPINFFTKQGYFTPSMHSGIFVVYCMVTALILVLFYVIRRGKSWAKILYIILFIWPLADNIWHFKRNAPELFATPLHTLNFALQNGLQLIAVVLLVLSFFKREPAQPPIVVGE